jgi:hypothetical protein
MFLEAIEAYHTWNEGEAEPKVRYSEVHFRPNGRLLNKVTEHEVTLSQACVRLWNCTDILPGGDFDTLDQCGLEPKRRTYAAGAHAMLAAIKDARERVTP